MDRKKPVESLMEVVPATFWPHLLGAVYDGYTGSFDEANATYDGPEVERYGHYRSRHAFWTHGYTRKAFVDRRILDAARKCNIFAKTEWNENETCPHTIVIVGSLILTSHFVRGRNDLVRPAEYRDNYFKHPQVQLNLWYSEEDSDDEVLTPTIDDPAFGVILHGESNKPWIPNFYRHRVSGQQLERLPPRQIPTLRGVAHRGCREDRH